MWYETGMSDDGTEAGPSEVTAKEVEEELARRFEEAYDENGVDRSLIRSTLARTPTERVMAVEETLNGLAQVRRIEEP